MTLIILDAARLATDGTEQPVVCRPMGHNDGYHHFVAKTDQVNQS